MLKYQTIKSAVKSLKGLQKVRRNKLTYAEDCTLESYFTAMGYDEDLIEMAYSTLHRDRLTKHICFVSAEQDYYGDVFFYIDSIEPNNLYKEPMKNCNKKFKMPNMDAWTYFTGIYIYKQGFKYFVCNAEQYDYINMDNVAFVGNKKYIQQQLNNFQGGN